MAFAKEPEKPKNIEDYFKDIEDYNDVLHMHWLMYGRMKVGKTHLAFSCIDHIMQHPEAKIYVLDTEGEANLLVKSMYKKRPETKGKFKVFRALHFADKAAGKIDLVKSLTATFEAIDVLTDAIQNNQIDPHSIVIVDSSSDIWEWLSIWLETIETKRNKSDGSMMRTEWGKANKRYLDFIYMLLSTDMHVIMTAISHPAVDDKGSDLGYDNPRWQKNTGRYFNLITELKKLGNERRLYFRGDRFGDIDRESFVKDPTFESVMNRVSDHSGVEFS